MWKLFGNSKGELRKVTDGDRDRDRDVDRDSSYIDSYLA